MLVALDHSRFHHVWSDVFTKRIVADCLTHSCTMAATDAPKLDACCQYGCDVDLFERDKILARADDIRGVLSPQAARMRWFVDDELEHDPDAPSGTLVRTEELAGGCVFLAHDRRGCAIHRAALDHGWDVRTTKPSVCQLFPLTYTTDAIVISDDYADYSCAHLPDAPSLYRVCRDALAAVFDVALVGAMDAAEARVLARRLPLA